MNPVRTTNLTVDKTILDNIFNKTGKTILEQNEFEYLKQIATKNKIGLISFFNSETGFRVKKINVIENNEIFKELLNGIKSAIESCISFNEPLDEKSWNDQHGIIISINEAKQIVEQLESNQWISVEDGLPEDGTTVICFAQDINGIRHDQVCFFKLYSIDSYVFDVIVGTLNTTTYADITDQVTHWMPLPQPPKSK